MCSRARDGAARRWARAAEWVLSFAAPFLLAGLFAIFLGAGGLLPATPAAAVTPALLPLGGAGVAALVSVGTAVRARPGLLRVAVRARARAARRSRSAPPRRCWSCGVALATLMWLANPYTRRCW